MSYLWKEYLPGWHLTLLAGKLDQLRRGEIRRLIVCMPPRHGKTATCSHYYPAFAMGCDPDLEVIACSYSASLAQTNNRRLQQIMESDEYRRIFPASWLPPRSRSHGAPVRNSEEFEIPGRRGKYRATGVGGSITGKGGKLLIIDDPLKDREEADSATIREKLWEWYTSTFITRAEPNESVLLVNTRWHQDDLTGRLLKLAESDPEADQWEVLKLPAIAENPEPPDPRSPGEALFPARVPLSKLLKFKRNSAYEWAALFQQNPSAEGGTEWDDSYFPTHIWFDEWPREADVLMRVTVLDPSKGKESKHGDYSAIVNIAITHDLTFYVDGDLERRPTDRLINESVDHAMIFRAHYYGVETNQFQELLAVDIQKAAAQRHVALPLVQIENNTSKVMRIRRVGPYLANDQLRFKKESKGARLLVDQLKEFPNGSHDDGPDALEMGIRIAVEKMSEHLRGQLQERLVGTI